MPRLQFLLKQIKSLTFWLLIAGLLSSCVGRIKGDIQSLAPNFSIQPAVLTMTVGKKVTFQVNDSIGSPIFAIASGIGTVDSLTGEFTAPTVEGQVVVRALDTSGRTSFAMIEVVTEPSLSPKDAEVVEGGIITFTVSGGKAPYNFAAVSGGTIDPVNGTFTAAIGATSATVSVMDALGSKAEVTFTVLSKLKFAQTVYSVDAGQQLDIQTTGGVGEVQYRVVGQGSYDVATHKFTAGTLSGSTVLQAKDLAGNIASAAINVTNGATVDDLIVMPEFSSLTPGAMTTISVQGGVEPIDLILESGSGTLDDVNRTYTASTNSIGEAVIRAVDSRGKSGTATITTLPKLDVNLNSELTDNSLYLEPGKTLEITPVGGVGPYVVTSYQGDVALVDGKYVYTAPNKPGMDAITIRDALGNSQIYYVFVESVMTLIPNQILVKKGEQFQYLVSGGKAPYTYALIEGDSLIAEDGSFTAGTAAQNIVRVTDSKGNTANSLVQIVQDMSVDPVFTIANPGQIIRFTVSGGVAPYIVTASQGTGKLCEALDTCTSATLTTQEGIADYLTSNASETASLTFVDANGTTLKSFIEIKKEYSISVTSQTLAIGGTVKLNVEGGTPPYTVTINPSNIASSSLLSSTSWNLKGLARGAAVIQVNDSTGASLTKNIEVFYRDSIAQLSGLPGSVSGAQALNVSVGGVDIESYKYAIGAGSAFSCTTATYGAESLPSTKITADISNSTQYPEGLIRLCVLAKNKDGKWQSASSATAYSWTKTQAPLAAQLAGLPNSITNQNSFNVTVTGRDGVTDYKYQFVNGTVANCLEANYSAAIAIASPIAITNATDGQKSLCVLISDGADWQVAPTTASWLYDGTVPTAPTSLNDGDSLALLTESPSITFTAGTDIGGSGVLKTEARLMNSDLSQEIATWTEFTSGSKFTNLNLSDGTLVRVQLRTVDLAQNLSTVVSGDGWIADTRGPLIAQLDGAPTGIVNTNSLNIAVSGRTGTSGYKYQIVAGDVNNCTFGGYSSEVPIATPITNTVVGDGAKTLCVLIGDGTSWQSTPTSKSWTFDGTAPSAPTVIGDGSFSLSLVESPAITFTPGADATSGVARTEIRLMNQDLSQEIVTWATFTSGSKITGLNLTSGATYKVQLRTVDNAGNMSTVATSDGWIVDTTNPTSPTTVTLANAFFNSTANSPTVTFSGGADTGSGIQKYQGRIVLASDNSEVKTWADLTSGSAISGASLVGGESYKVEVRTIDNVGLISVTAAQSSAWAVDTDVPTAPTGFTLGAIPFSLSETPTITWTTDGTDTGGSGLAGYQAAVYKNGVGTPVKNWATITSGGKFTSGFALEGGSTYYFSVRSVDNAGNASVGENSTTWVANQLEPCLGSNPAAGTACSDGSIYVGKYGINRYVTTPGGCEEIPAGQVAGGSGATTYSTTDFTPNCTGDDLVIKSFNNGGTTWFDHASVANYTGTAGIGNGLINTDTGFGSANSSFWAATTAGASGGYYAAAMYCEKLVYNGKTNWHLPNRYELNQMYAAKASFPGLVNSLYWSSSENSNMKAWGQNFSTGSQDPADKNSTFFVRCFRNLDLSPDTMVFTQVNAAPLSSTQESNVVTVTGVEGEISVSVSGGGTPQIAKSTDGGTTWSAWATSQTVIANNKLKLKVTTGTTMSQLFTVTITPGAGANVTWKVYTMNTDPCLGAGVVPTAGTVCTGSYKFAYEYNSFRYMTTPSGCGTATNNPTCTGGTDTAKFMWNAGSSNLYEDVTTLSNYKIDTSWTWSGSWCSNASTRIDSSNGVTATSNILSYNASFAAAKYCNDLIWGGKSDWFLPDIDEQYKMYQVKTALGGGFANDYYWSATECQGNTTFSTYVLGFGSGCHEGPSRNTPYYVRCMRRDPAP